jgi:hypothetical protein
MHVGVIDRALRMRDRTVFVILVGMVMDVRLIILAMPVGVIGLVWSSDRRVRIAPACGKPQDNAHDEHKARTPKNPL